MSTNGLILCDRYVAPELMLHLFRYFDIETLLIGQLVCKQWRTFITHDIWREKAEKLAKRKLRELSWHDYYIVFKRIGQNLIPNPSGEKGFSGWDILYNHGHGWKIESPPIGAPLPELGNTCFVTSFATNQKYCVVDLWQHGFTDKILDSIKAPIQISESYCCRYDCPAEYELVCHLCDKDRNIIDEFNFKDKLYDDRQNKWFKIEHRFEYRQGVRYVLCRHGGRDNRFWAGHYGSKMTALNVMLLPSQ